MNPVSKWNYEYRQTCAQLALRCSTTATSGFFLAATEMQGSYWQWRLSVSKDPSSQILYALWNYIKITLGQVLNWVVLQRNLKSLTFSPLVYFHHHSQFHWNIKLYRHTNFALRTLSLVPQKLLISSKETSFTMLRDIKGEKPQSTKSSHL